MVLVGPGSLSDPSYTIRQVLAYLQGVVHVTPMANCIYDVVLGCTIPTTCHARREPLGRARSQRRLAEMVRVASARHYWNSAPELDLARAHAEIS